MSGLVVHASVVVAWLFDDEAEPRADRALERVEEDGALVPQMWHLEIRETPCCRQSGAGVYLSGEVKERLDALRGLPIRTDEEPDLQSAFNLARAHGLSFYDAVYLELAKREGAELATLDGALDQTAVAEGVPLSAT